MTTLTSVELKRFLAREGLEVYRTLPDRVVLAERVRDNLLMDGGVAACLLPSLSVLVTLRAQASDFPGEIEKSLFERVRRHGGFLRERGYAEVDMVVAPLHDPNDKSRTLDTWYEVSLRRTVPDLPTLLEELRICLATPRLVSAGGRA
jgi:hypothetical protein